MKIVPIDSVPVETLEQPRTGVFLMQRLVEGVEGASDNFSLELVKTFSDFYSPRHKHNFDQVRLQIEGRCDFHRNGKMESGMVGYFPEGTPYGPQKATEDALVLVLQFAGASAAPYMSKKQLGAGVEHLRQFGEFKNGAYSRTDADGHTYNKDAYEAVWEHVFKRPLEYPEPRYHDPVMMEPRHFAWVPRAGEPGVQEKQLGIFTERRTDLFLLRLDPGTKHRAVGSRLYFVTDGTGRIGGQEWGRHTTVHLAPGEESVLEAVSPTEILVIGFPTMATEEQAEAAA